MNAAPGIILGTYLSSQSPQTRHVQVTYNSPAEIKNNVYDFQMARENRQVNERAVNDPAKFSIATWMRLTARTMQKNGNRYRARAIAPGYEKMINGL